MGEKLVATINEIVAAEKLNSCPFNSNKYYKRSSLEEVYGVNELEISECVNFPYTLIFVNTEQNKAKFENKRYSLEIEKTHFDEDYKKLKDNRKIFIFEEQKPRLYDYKGEFVYRTVLEKDEELEFIFEEKIPKFSLKGTKKSESSQGKYNVGSPEQKEEEDGCTTPIRGDLHKSWIDSLDD